MPPMPPYPGKSCNCTVSQGFGSASLQASANPLAGYNVEQLAQLIRALQQLGLITLGGQNAANSVALGPNNEPSHVFSILGDMGGAPGGGGVAIAGSVAAKNAAPAVKKEATQAPLTPSKLRLSSPKSVPALGTPRHNHHPPPSSLGSPQVHTSTLPWYTVTMGYDVRIFQGWDQVTPLVIGIFGAVFQCHSSLASTHIHYVGALARDNVKVVPRPSDEDYDSYNDNDE
ncbi:hypothetical protein EDD18DRAFT_1367187 [Armillaria luteobubalina]|uniref:Uncharacterized protein n=1 Tax=Armillaria luteobubalina TaxID=153913 RepID=A0AA39P0X1_9AGAR|nr:hypothetical protein EDD18DRAFT_1367187 [Armillaria luteobubalina]